jgi:hypothetical protein
LADHEELWIFGNQTIEVWNDTGAANFPLQRNSSGFIPQGCIAANSPVSFAQTVAWLGGDARGATCAWMASGFTPAQVSTPAVEAAWNSYATTSDAVSYTYIDEGHYFWVLCFPTANATWAYDFNEKTWHQRAWWNGTALQMQRQIFHGYLWGMHIVGDYGSGWLYQQSSSNYTDAGVAITRQRAAAYIGDGINRVYFGDFALDTEQNIANPAGTGLILDYSDDGGQTFINPRSANADTTTGDAGRVVWRRNGKSRGRVFRVTYSGGGKVAWINAKVEATQGSN